MAERRYAVSRAADYLGLTIPSVLRLAMEGVFTVGPDGTIAEGELREYRESCGTQPVPPLAITRGGKLRPLGQRP